MKNKTMTMIPGPTPIVRSIQNQMGREVTAFGDPLFIQDFKDLIADLKQLLNTSGEVFVVAGTGTMAMEMAVANVTKRGEDVLLISHGFFGDRFIELCSRKGLNVDALAAEWGQIVSLATIEEKLRSKAYAAVIVTHVDTSTGVSAPVAEIGDILKRYPKTLYIVDGVCATAAEPEDLDGMGIDVLLTGSQKAFGVSPGLAMVWASERALAKRKALGSIPEYYIDFEKWLPIMENPAKYFATPAIHLIWALKEAVRIIFDEGVENRYNRHKKIACGTQKALEALGFSILADENHRAVTLSNILYPEGVEDMAFRAALAEEGVQVAGGLGAYAGKMFRLGHMGNIDLHDSVAVIATIERVLYKMGNTMALGKGVGVFMEAVLTWTDERENRMESAEAESKDETVLRSS